MGEGAIEAEPVLRFHVSMFHVSTFHVSVFHVSVAKAVSMFNFVEGFAVLCLRRFWAKTVSMFHVSVFLVSVADAV